MRLAISNIAWLTEEETSILSLLKDYGVEGIEIAPTKYWPDPISATPAEIKGLKSRLNNAGFEIPAAQALLYGHPELVIFRDAETRARTLEYLVQIGILCSKLGIKTLIFGSPKNRVRKELPMSAAMDIASNFFYSVAQKITPLEITLSIEPNPKEYGCDFIQTTQEGLEFVQHVNHPNFRLHLDTSAMTLNKEDPAQVIPLCLSMTRHVHISEPHLGLPGSRQTDHRLIAATLKRSGYDGWVSIEMRSGIEADNSVTVRRALEYTRSIYR